MNFLGDARGMVGEELKRLGVEIIELRLHKHTFLVGKKVLELQSLAEGNLLVLAIQRADGNVLKSGFLEELLREKRRGDHLGSDACFTPAAESRSGKRGASLVTPLFPSSPKQVPKKLSKSSWIGNPEAGLGGSAANLDRHQTWPTKFEHALVCEVITGTES
jgi:hypothetical protein